uniref:Maturase K n=1 Tax=Gastoniella chaerophylla TaxID=170708 RepID=A0A3G5CRY1_9MONI|nr:maturase K [Gastoniella chaerophylla]AYW15619.1 maturase K [Gastoniella chaerophylla]
MKTTYGSFTRKGASQKNDKFDKKRNCFSYPYLFLFEEKFYLMNRQQRSNGVDIQLLSGSWSTVSIKRLIDNVRDLNYLKTDNSGFVQNQMDYLDQNLYFNLLLEIICLILGVSLLHEISNEKISILNMSQSIHSIFLFLEDRFPKSNQVLKTDLPKNLHLETLIRLFRRQIQDVLFLHLLRKISYRDIIICEKIVSKTARNIDTLFHNFYTYGIDFLLFSLRKQICKGKVNDYVPIDRNNIIQKAKNTLTYYFESNFLGTDSYFTQGLCIHYGRYRNKIIIVSRGTCYFVSKWLYYFLIFLKQHFHYQTRFNQLRLELISVSCVSFLGYTSIAKLVLKQVRVETVMGLRVSGSSEKKFYPKIPILILLKILAKQNFCESNGRPIGKLGWSVLTDDEIIKRFVQIWRAFSLYYGASPSRNKLLRLRYILQISCSSTLSSKHRSIKHLLRRRFNLDLRSQFILSNEFESFHNRRIWHLSLIRSNLAKFVQSEMAEMGL